jgi:aspartate/tyrosine/aromatic aminotransferase
MHLDVDPSELDILEVALDNYRREVKRERKDIKIFLKKVTACFGLAKAYALYEEEQQKLNVLDVDRQRCQTIKRKLQH